MTWNSNRLRPHLKNPTEIISYSITHLAYVFPKNVSIRNSIQRQIPRHPSLPAADDSGSWGRWMVQMLTIIFYFPEGRFVFGCVFSARISSGLRSDANWSGNLVRGNGQGSPLVIRCGGLQWASYVYEDLTVYESSRMVFVGLGFAWIFWVFRGICGFRKGVCEKDTLKI